MTTYIVWADNKQAEAVAIEAADMPAAIEQAAESLNIDPGQVNIIDASRVGEAEYHGVAHALPTPAG